MYRSAWARLCETLSLTALSKVFLHIWLNFLQLSYFKFVVLFNPYKYSICFTKIRGSPVQDQHTNIHVFLPHCTLIFVTIGLQEDEMLALIKNVFCFHTPV